MKKSILGLAALTALAFVACKKNDDQSNAQKIIAKWKHVNAIDKATTKSTGAVVSDTINFSASDYVDFRTNGYVYFYEHTAIEDYYDTAQYKVNGNQLIVTWAPNDADTATITTLTGSALSTYEKTESTQTIDEYFDNLKK